MKEKKQEIIWNFDNVVSEAEQLKRIDLFNEIIIDIAVNHYIDEKKNSKDVSN
jgi:hypothetical protein